MQTRGFKNGVYEQLARVGKAVSSPKRIELLELIVQGEHTVEALAHETAITVANASQHLQVLRAARLVDTRREGVSIYYRPAGDSIGKFVSALRTLAEGRLAELSAIINQLDRATGDIETLDSPTLHKRMKDGNVLLLDTRPHQEYAAAHLPGAVNVPLAELPKKLRDLPKTRSIVAYCRGPYCLFATEAVQLLQKKGYHAARLRDGVHDWAAHGFRLETTQPVSNASRKRLSIADS